MSQRHLLFLVGSARAPGTLGNTEWLARQAAAALPATDTQTWLHLQGMDVPEFQDHRHDRGTYPMPEGDARRLLDATLAATDLVLVAPLYWYGLPASLKRYLDHWSAWMRVEGLGFLPAMAGKRLWVVNTSGDRAKSQPLFDQLALVAQFAGMHWQGALWGKGGPPGAVEADAAACAGAVGFLTTAVRGTAHVPQ